MPELQIFPEGSLSESVVTTVWVGMFVVCLLNLRFGWTFSGLVVPGYMVPLMIAKPWGAAVVIVESVLTYCIVWFLSDWCARRGLWSSLFGRDRFFAFVICSVIVRIGLDGYLLPYVGRIVAERYHLQFDPVNTLHSFGLIIVSLIANQLWKPGLRRGLLTLVVTIGATYVLVRYPLMIWTNFSVSSLEYMYEDISSSVLASPKAYVILITAAFLASRMNLYYAWDFNGILIPSLLALQWYEPLKILTSFIEAWFIYLAGILVLRTPMLRETTIEGARKLLVFFNLSFLYKLTIGHLVALAELNVQVTDLYGFGYLLPTLMAVKMHDKGIAARLTRTTLQTSIMATVLASVIGFSLSFTPILLGSVRSSDESGLEMLPTVQRVTLRERLRRDKITIYRQRVLAAVVTPLPQETSHFRAGLQALKVYLRGRTLADLSRAREHLRLAGYEMVEIEDRYLYLVESGAKRGWGIYVIDTRSTNGLLVEVPRPIDEWATLECGAYLFRTFEGRSLAISTAMARESLHSSNDPINSHRGLFTVFHREFGRRESLRVRAATRRSERVFRRTLDEDPTHTEPTSRLWVRNELPEALRLEALSHGVEGYRVHWGTAPLKNTLDEFPGVASAELFLKRSDRKKLLGRYLVGVTDVQAREELQRIDGYLQQEILHKKGQIADRGTNLYRPPGIESMLFFDEEILGPIMSLSRASRDGSTPPEFHSEVEVIQGAALAVNYGLIWYRHQESNREYLILSESDDTVDRRYWGTYVFRLGAYRPLVIEVPHPLYERNTFEYGVSLFEKLGAGFLLISGTHPKCNVDNSGDVTDVANKVNLFHMVHQTIVREYDVEELLVVQVRAFGHRPGVSNPMADALLSLSDGAVGMSSLTDLGKEVLYALEEDRFHVKFVGGDLDTEGYEAHTSVQAQYLANARNKLLATVWLSPFVRLGFKQHAETRLQDAQMDALDVPTREGFLPQFLAGATITGSMASVPASMIDALEHYQETQDINALLSLKTLWPEPEHRLVRFIDVNSQKGFLLIYRGGGILPFVASLSYSPGERHFVRASLPVDVEEVRKFVDSTAVFLFLRSEE